MFNPLSQLIGDTRTDLGQMSSRTGRSLQDDMNGVDLSQFIQGGGKGSYGSFHTKLPQWSPGEFAEWKQAAINKVPTIYGKIMQDRYRRGKHRILPSAGQVERENETLATHYPNAFSSLRKQYGDY